MIPDRMTLFNFLWDNFRLLLRFFFICFIFFKQSLFIYALSYERTVPCTKMRMCYSVKKKVVQKNVKYIGLNKTLLVFIN